MATPETEITFEGIKIPQPAFDAPAALEHMDRFIQDVYLPMRGADEYGTERATIVAPSHVHHRENDAEHSWSISALVLTYWSNQEELGIVFPPNFDVYKAMAMADIHDVSEVFAPDVDALTPHLHVLEGKNMTERFVMRGVKKSLPYLRGLVDLWEEYERKDTPEAQFVNDLDKVLGTRVICHDGGRKWHLWKADDSSGGYTSDRTVMEERMRAKIITPFGHQLFDALSADLDKHPEYFANNAGDPQGRLF